MSIGADADEQDLRAAMVLHRRNLSDEQMRKFASYAAKIFTTLGLDLNTPATKDTPRRFLRALLDITVGYDGDPHLLTVFATACRGDPDRRPSQVMEGPIQFFSLCEHQALPIIGHAYMGYIAHEHAIDISKLTRLERLFPDFTPWNEGQRIWVTLGHCWIDHSVERAAVYVADKTIYNQSVGPGRFSLGELLQRGK